jgi:hypothetical protein
MKGCLKYCSSLNQEIQEEKKMKGCLKYCSLTQEIQEEKKMKGCLKYCSGIPLTFVMNSCNFLLQD